MNLMKSASRFLKKNGGTILAIGASMGVVLTAIETGKASIKAEKLIEMNSAEPAYTTKEKVKDCWKFYLPAAALGAGTIACILGSNCDGQTSSSGGRLCGGSEADTWAALLRGTG